MIFVHHVQLLTITDRKKKGVKWERLKLKSFTCQNMHVQVALYMSNVRLGPFVDKPLKLNFVRQKKTSKLKLC